MSMFQRLGNQAQQPQQQSQDPRSAAMELMKRQGKDKAQVLALIDELMSTVEVINRRLYLGVMRRLEEIP